VTGVPDALTRPIGPLPVAGWLGVIAGGYVLSNWARRKNPAAPPA
jgi:uncharacterized membrane protein